MSARVRFIEHKNRRILFLDLAQLNGDDPATVEAIEAARQAVAALPRERTLLSLVDATGSAPTPKSMEALKEYAKHNTPWVLASAVVGITPILRLFLRIITFTSGRKVAVLRTLDEGKEWLVAQKEPPSEIPQDFIDFPTDK